jgi:TonB family protein
VVKTIEREMPQPKEKKAEKEIVKEEKVAKKTDTPVDKVKTEKPPPVDRNKIREKIARKGILGVLTGKGRAGSRHSENILNRMDEVSRIDVKVAHLENIESPVGKEDKSFVDSNISSLIEESKLGSEKEFETRVYKMETGAEMEISGDIEDKDRSAQIISSVISSYLGGIKYVYNRELKNNPNLSGKITVSYIINPDGTVSDISIKESTVNWPPLEEKLIKRIKHWKFPPSKSRKVRIVFPFLFFPSM